MRKVKIVTDSCSDLSGSLLEKYGIAYAKMSTVFQGVETPASLTWSEEEVHAFYGKMRQGERITTTQVPTAEFQRVFGQWLEAGYDIVYIACSSGQSGSVNTGRVVAGQVLESYPEGKILCIDSLNASLGEGLLAITAAEMANGGMGAEEIEAQILALRKTVNQYVTVHSLDALRRAGRVKGPAAFFGNLMGVKPIIVSDKNGAQAAYKKVKGRQKSFQEIVSLLKATILRPEEQWIYLAHADCAREEVETLVSLIKQEIPCRGVEVGFIGPIIGASIGPEAVGVWAFGQEVTYQAGE